MIVVTGAAGLVGGNLVRALLTQGCSVRALKYADDRALKGLPIESVRADLLDLNSLFNAFQDAEVVYHLASAISIRLDSWERVSATNIIGTRNVAEACLRTGVRRLVHFSSIHALQQAPLDQPLDESRPRITSSKLPPYERSKAAGDLEIVKALDRGLDVVTIVPSAIVGPFDFKPSYFGQAMISLVKGRIPALVTGGYDFVDVRDVVDGAIAAEKSATAGASYILSGHWHTVREVAGMVAKLSGTRPPKWVVPLWLARLAAPLMTGIAQLNGSEPLYTQASLGALHSNRFVSHARATRELGYQPRPLQETIFDMLQWFNENGYIVQPSRINGYRE